MKHGSSTKMLFGLSNHHISEDLILNFSKLSILIILSVNSNLHDLLRLTFLSLFIAV